jgi:hypothetical protein
MCERMEVYLIALLTSELYLGEKPILQTFPLILGERQRVTRRIADCLDNMTRGGMSKFSAASAVTWRNKRDWACN